MKKLDYLRASVHKLYEEKTPTQGDWADWLYPNHVLSVAGHAEAIAKEVGANVELSIAAALLHDISDAVMPRADPKADAKSLELARQMLHKASFNEHEIEIVVNDAIKKHSCRDGKLPDSLEGKVLATADALAHFNTDFYLFAAYGFGKDRSYAEYITWLERKIEKDYHVRIAFEDMKSQVKAQYQYFRVLVDLARAGQQR